MSGLHAARLSGNSSCLDECSKLLHVEPGSNTAVSLHARKSSFDVTSHPGQLNLAILHGWIPRAPASVTASGEEVAILHDPVSGPLG